MNRTVLFLGCALALALSVPNASAQGSTSTARDAPFLAILDNFDAAYDKHDAAMWVRHFALDADFMNAFGVYRKGRASIQQFMGEFMSHQSPGFRRRIEERRIQLVGADVAFVEETGVGTGIKNADGTEQPPRYGHLMMVLRRQGDTWRIAHYRFVDIHTEKLAR